MPTPPAPAESGVSSGLFMQEGSGQDRVDRDVAELLRIFESKGDCLAFLRTLPLYVGEHQEPLPLAGSTRR